MLLGRVMELKRCELLNFYPLQRQFGLVIDKRQPINLAPVLRYTKSVIFIKYYIKLIYKLNL